MSESPDGRFTRLFAQAAVPGSDEGFVAGVVAEVARRRAARRARRVALMVALPTAAVALAALLAPFAPVAPVAELGNSLLDLPEQVGAAAATAHHLPGAWYLGIALVIVALPLASAAWLSRRA